MSQDEYFLSLLNEKISKFDEESKKHKHNHRFYRYGVFFLAAVTSILSGAALGYTSIQTELNFLIVIIGAFTGIVTSIEGLRRPNDLWIMERNVHYSLLDLKEEYEFEKKGNNHVGVAKYFDRMQQILNSSKEKWMRKVSKESGKDKEEANNGN